MKNISAFAVAMPAVGVARALRVGTRSAHAATAAHAAAAAVAAPRKRRTAAATAAFVDGGAS